ncbi:MAG: M12 family metallo-peptidase [Thiotrichaceae bacterium]
MRLFILSIILASSQVLADEGYWKDETSGNTDQRVLSLDTGVFNEKLLQGVTSYYTKKAGIQNAAMTHQTILLPLPDGKNVLFSFEETHVMAPPLAKRFPTIKTYKVSGFDDPSVQGRMNSSEQGFYASLQTGEGRSVVIEPIENQQQSYRSVWADSVWDNESVSKKRQQPDVMSCQLTDYDSVINAYKKAEPIQAREASIVATNIYVYRIAVSASSSYVSAHGGTKTTAMAAIAQTINRVNQIYERDTGVRLQLVANNDQLVFTSDDLFSGSLRDMLSQNQRLIDRVIGSDNYDVGHLFTAQGGGLAYVGSACRSDVKAMGVSGNIRVGGERFALEFVAHEIAHQFSATHTFNSNQGLCSENNRNGATAYEPGSGSTIMSYIGICGSDNLQSHADGMFHIGSIQQIVKHKVIHQVNGCGVLVSTGTTNTGTNNAPEVNAGADFTIPANTPFELVGVASDSDNDTMLYNWEQQDSGLASQVDEDTGNNALFRSYLPISSTQRTFPRKVILLGLESAKGETLPTTNRLMHFEFIAQDSKGASVSDAMILDIVTDDKTFKLHTPPLYYARGEDIKVTWEVANTHLPPVSCSSVDISLSMDNGLHFNQLLAGNIPNSGMAIISLPSSVLEQTQARLKLSCSDNVFFSISSRAFGTAPQGTQIPDSSASVASGNDVNNTNNTSGGGGSLSMLWFLLLSGLFVAKSLFIAKGLVFSRSCCCHCNSCARAMCGKINELIDSC